MGVSRCDLQGNRHVQLEWEQRMKGMHPDLLSIGLAAPALRALWRLGVREPHDLGRFEGAQLLREHGMGLAGVRLLQVSFPEILKP
jgi:hypothetical protein